MSLLPLVLLAAVMAAHAGHVPESWSLVHHPLPAASLWIGLPASSMFFALWWFGSCARAIRHGRLEVLPVAGKVLRGLRAVMVMSGLIFVLLFDGLSVIRHWTGDVILLDELVLLLPVLSGYYLLGVAWYSIESALAGINGASEGLTNRWSSAWNSFVIQVLLLFIPAALIFSAVEFFGSMDPTTMSDELRQLFLLMITGIIFIGAPLAMRLLLSLTPLESGQLRDRLEQVCRRQGVSVREILCWNTGGALVNAAVVGMVGRIRYILLTDSMIRCMPERYVEAVMAHEVGHARCRHMPWLLATIVAVVLGIEAIWLAIPPIPHVDGLIRLAILILAVWLGFGWISRRFEWQADACAARDLSEAVDPGQQVTLEATTAMIGALQSISALNGDDGRRHDWRHGSIRLRCHRLADLVGRAHDSLPIDRVVGRIKITTVLVGLISVLSLSLFLSNVSS